MGYAPSSANHNTALGIYKKIESWDADPSSRLSHVASKLGDQAGLREKYKSFIRQLPAKPYIEPLVACFFRHVNWQYSPLDEGIFRDMLARWYRLSWATLNRGPRELAPDVQSFPALLFQMVAMALQCQPIEDDRSLESLKYASGMTFDDLASDYSDCGCQILLLLGKRNPTIVTVQAGFLRTAYLKHRGMVTESWHHLSCTIRDAQELAFHKSGVARRPRPPEERRDDMLERLWLEQLRLRLWLILSLWDIHMAIVLGRPATIDPRDGKPAFPIDAPAPVDRRKIAPTRRTDADPPTPLTMLLWSAELAAPLWDILALQKEDPAQIPPARLASMHASIDTITRYCPSFFRAHNPDTRFDSHPDCYWLPCARAILQNGAPLAIMALHRPYVFTRPPSRTAALQAGLDVLRAQRTYFNLLSARHYKLFSLVLNTFDAIVLIAAIYILHPTENSAHVEDALQHFQWGMDRFEKMGGRNPLASAALNILRAICVRLQKALNRPVCAPRAETDMSTVDPQLQVEALAAASTPTLPPPASPGHASPMAASSHSLLVSGSSAPASTLPTLSPATTQYTLPTISNLTEPPSAPPPVPPPLLPAAAVSRPHQPPWDTFSTPPSFDFSSMAPLQPMHDLVFNNLGGTVDGGGGGGLDMAAVGGLPMPGNPSWDDPQQWQFAGDFGSDSFWGFMNHY